jgi:ATP-dependent 26S proteasome regulatory subunit
LSIKGRGGGKPRGGVIKTIVKCSLSEKTLASDEKLFADCYKLAVSVHASTSTSLKTALNSMSDADLQELQDYILKDKTTNALKVAKLAEWLGEYKLIVKVQQKLSSSLEAMKDMVQADLEKNFSVDGFPQIGMVKDLVGKIIYARGEAREPSMKD